MPLYHRMPGSINTIGTADQRPNPQQVSRLGETDKIVASNTSEMTNQLKRRMVQPARDAG